MEVELVKNVFKNKEIKMEWEKLYESNNDTSPYMRYAFQKVYNRFLPFSKNRLFAKYMIFRIAENGHTIALLPLIKIKNAYFLAGDKTSTGALDALYDSTISMQEFHQMIDQIKIAINNAPLHFNKIPEYSKTSEFFRKDGVSTKREMECVNIAIPDDYTDYLNSLSKSVRQNIRTAYNRLRREEKDVRVSFFDGNNVDQEIKKKVMALYHQRAIEKNGSNGRLLDKFKNYLTDLINPMTNALFSIDDTLLCVLFIENEIAGFFHGIISHNKRLVVPRLAINSEFGVYCPGSILISEAIKYLIDNSSIRELDLSRGNEKYKYSLGGLKYLIYDYGV